MNPTPTQMRAVIYLVFFIMIIGAVSRFGPTDRGAIPDHTETNLPGLFVELNAEPDKKGIYYLPLFATQLDLLKAAALNHATVKIAEDSKLKPGATYHLAGGILAPQGMMTAEKRLLLGLRLDINQVTKEELMLIPQIGPKTAEQIITFREGRGGFKSLAELKEIKGIKDKRWEILKKYLTIGSEAGQ